MMVDTMNLKKNTFSKETPVELYLKKQITIAAGATGTISVQCPKEQSIYLKGYGYDWFEDNKYNLRAGKLKFPQRVDQEGSISQPVVYSYPFQVLQGDNLSLKINNDSAAEHTYQVLFILLSSSVLDGVDFESQGGAIILQTGVAAGTITPIVITDSTGTTEANVTANGLQVENNAPVTLRCGTKTTTAALAVAIAGTTALKKGVLLQAYYTNADYVVVGNATNQEIRLYAGDSIFIEINDLAKVFIKRPAAINVGVSFEGS